MRAVRKRFQNCTRIDHSCAQPSAPRAVSQAVNGCAAHVPEQGFRSFTTWKGEVLKGQNQFHIISIQRRLADHAFSNARTWPEIQQAHKTWWTTYNSEHHFAHRERQDGRHSPSEVLRGVLGRPYPEEVLTRVLYATQFTRHLDRHGYVKFRSWRFFGEDGLAGEEVSVWVYEDTLKIEYQATALSLYALTFQPDHQQIAKVKNPRRIQTHFRSPQLDLWQLSDTEWLLALRRPEPITRKKQGKIVPLPRQRPLPSFGATR